MTRDELFKQIVDFTNEHPLDIEELTYTYEKLIDREDSFVKLLKALLFIDYEQVPSISLNANKVLEILSYDYKETELAEACRIAALRYKDPEERVSKLGGILYNRKHNKLTG